jgi:nucleoside 2-deoxyribosyltransferase
MTITICGSMQFHKEMIKTKTVLEKAGHKVFIPSGAYDFRRNEAYAKSDEEIISIKIEYDCIREHFQFISKSDAILVLNYEKKGIPNYIGGNTFLEMGYAFGLDKKIYLFNPIPQMNYSTEMHAMQPKVIHGDLLKIS